MPTPPKRPAEAIECPLCGGLGYPPRQKWLEELLANEGTSWAAPLERHKVCSACSGRGFLTAEDIERALLKEDPYD
jgi:hypothetical protein